MASGNKVTDVSHLFKFEDVVLGKKTWQELAQEDFPEPTPAPFYVVRNFSRSSVWCKNENDSGVFEVPPGDKTKRRIDGLTHPKKPGQVYKVVTTMMDLLGIDVFDDGLAFQSSFFPIDKDINALGGGGWLTAPPDDGWNPIFEKA